MKLHATNDKINFICGALLCFAGGAMDAYSYVLRGGVLATAQTANILLLGINLAEKKWARGAQYLIPVVCFVTAVYLTKLIHEKLCHHNTSRWQRGIVFAEVLGFGVLGFCDAAVPSWIVNAAISFLAAMQYCAFRNFGTEAPYATVFCTGNLRSFTDNVYDAVIHKNKISRKKAAGYSIVLTSFCAGAFSCRVFIEFTEYRAIWLVCLALLTALFISHLYKEERM